LKFLRICDIPPQPPCLWLESAENTSQIQDLLCKTVNVLMLDYLYRPHCFPTHIHFLILIL
jgi:hypothetical protein